MRGEKKEMKPEVLRRGLINPTMAFLWAAEGWAPGAFGLAHKQESFRVNAG